MSFKNDEFISYLKGKGLKSARTYCTYLRKTERELNVDLDAEFRSDRCTALSETLETVLSENKVITKSKNGRRGKVSNAKKKRYNALRQMRNSLRKYIDFRSAPEGCDTAEDEISVLPKEFEESLTSVDRPVWDTMIGTVRDGQQLEFILKYSGYYVPANFISEDRLPIRYIALHEQGIGSDPGIRRYGEVMTAQKIKRSRIPVPMSRNNRDELYYYFKIRLWEELPRAIDIRDTHRGAPLFTNKILLDSCTQSYQLFSVASADDFRLMTVINKAFEDLKNSKDKTCTAVYPINKSYKLCVSEGHLSLVNSKGETLEKISVGSYSYRPRDSFNRFKKILGT